MVGTEQFVQPISGTISIAPVSGSGFVTNQKVVTTSGTPVQLQTQVVTDGFQVVVKAKYANTGLIYVGNSSPNALKTSGTNITLLAGSAIGITCDNVNDIWIDAAVNGEGVEWIVETA